MKYRDYLNKLLGYADKLPEIYKHLVVIVAEFQAIMALLGKAAPGDGTLSLVSPSDEEAALEAQVATAIGGEGALFDLSTLRTIFAVLEATGLLDKFFKG